MDGDVSYSEETKTLDKTLEFTDSGSTKTEAAVTFSKLRFEGLAGSDPRAAEVSTTSTKTLNLTGDELYADITANSNNYGRGFYAWSQGGGQANMEINVNKFDFNLKGADGNPPNYGLFGLRRCLVLH